MKYKSYLIVNHETCAAAFAVPEMLCVSGLVALTCMTVTKPIANPITPVTIIALQNNNDRSFDECSFKS
jgi:hypothetical protein